MKQVNFVHVRCLDLNYKPLATIAIPAGFKFRGIHYDWNCFNRDGYWTRHEVSLILQIPGSFVIKH